MNVKENIDVLLKHFKSRDYNQVMNTCEKILKINDKIPEVYNFYGLALQSQKKHEQAINYFNKAISLNSKDYSAYNNIANSYKSLLINEKAYLNFEKCLKINPKYFPALINFAILKKELNEHEGSIELFSNALEIKPNPDQVKILFSISELYEQKGEIEKAKDIILKILELDSSNSAAHYILSKYLNYKKNKTHIQKMETLFKNNNIGDENKTNFAFALGRAFEGINEYEKSFSYYQIANNLKRKKINYDHNYYSNLKTELINFFEKFNFDKIKKYTDKKVIFICGMPRSGTTLIDQIISSHSEVVATGENSILSQILETNILKKFNKNKENINNFLLSEGENLNTHYFSRLENLNVFKNTITDKTVQNFIWIGFIRSLFPNSKIINCIRNPKEICFSIYKNYFHNNFMNWSYRQTEIALFYNFYSELMKFWDYKFPNEIYHVKYEDLLQNPEHEMKKLIKACDLSWEKNCLDFHKNKNFVKTASSVQVRKPLYSSSQNLAKNYSIYLSEMFNLLII